jgi:hypothetical protein
LTEAIPLAIFLPCPGKAIPPGDLRGAGQIDIIYFIKPKKGDLPQRAQSKFKIK